jgi:hypothetical protein
MLVWQLKRKPSERTGCTRRVLHDLASMADHYLCNESKTKRA